MQTFLPYKDFELSARVLDMHRLGCQRKEAAQILNHLRPGTVTFHKSTGRFPWAKHPVVEMWTGYEPALINYYNACVLEWLDRGYECTLMCVHHSERVVMPPWLGDPRVHRSHQSQLLRKDPIFYDQYRWDVPIDLDYHYPTRQ